MRWPCRWLSVVVLGAAACDSNGLPESPTAPSLSLSASASASAELASMPQFGPPPNSDGNWSPWFFPAWQAGIAASLAPDGSVVDAVVEVDDLCVSYIRATWDARTSCKRFTVSVPSDGWLDASLRWDTTAPGFDPSLSGDVVLVAPSGRFTASDWRHTEEQISALVEPGDYGVLVMSYVPVSLPFQIKLELRPQN